PSRDRGRETGRGHRHAAVRRPQEDDAARPDRRRPEAIPGRLAESPEIGRGSVMAGTGSCVPPADLALRRVAVVETSRDLTEDFIRVEGLAQGRGCLSPGRVELRGYVQVGGP